jgi:hypothetical protein
MLVARPLLYPATSPVLYLSCIRSIPAKIEEGLERSRVLVLCMSETAFGSDWAQLEAGTFRFRDPLGRTCQTT